SWADRFFIADGAQLTSSVSFTAEDINAITQLGFVAIQVVGAEGAASANASIMLNDPKTESEADERISLPELYDILASPDTILSGGWVNFDLAGSAELGLPLVFTPDVLGDGHPTPEATVTWTDITDPSTLAVDFNLDIDIDALLSNLTFETIIWALDEAREIVDDLETGNAFFERKLPLINKSISETVDFRHFIEWGKGRESYRVGKKAAGRLLDGREHNEMPEATP
ncbi:hypothetical protein LCGC14_2690270, partial [marine sediment metagenome]